MCSYMQRLTAAFLCMLVVFVSSCAEAPNNKAAAEPTVEEAKAFMAEAESTLTELGLQSARAAWVNANFITEDTEALTAAASQASSQAVMDFAKQSVRFDNLELPPELARKFKLLKLGTSMPVPSDPEKAKALSETVTKLKGLYGKGKYDGKALGELSNTLATSRDPKALLDAWQGWRTISPPMRGLYADYVRLANEGAQDLGFKDLGDMWCSGYDMEPADFAAELDRLWEQVKPLYVSLHTYVRKRLREHYGPDVVPAKGPIPAHLLGNMWSQSWGNIYPLLAPDNADPGYDLTEILNKQKGMDAIEMVKIGERFFTSVGFEPLPQTFWDRSLFTKPADRDVVCHASAWDIDARDDIRIKMCIKIDAEDFVTIHHELGHNFYQRAYKDQPYFFRDSANDGFHEAVGDTLALSITPKYLVDLGYLDSEPDESKDIGLLMKQALDKVAFLPFGLLIDQWRWKVFSGEISEADYNKAWWELRKKYQGIEPPVARDESHFDPGAKYHVPANVAYTRYFLAHILQFQFHRGLAKEAGAEGPLHRASIYGSKQAGERLNNMLEMGLSKPWPDALDALVGERQMDASAIIDYFAPLKAWLDEQNQGETPGWE